MPAAADLEQQLDNFIKQVTGSALDPLLGSNLPFVDNALDAALKAAGLNSLLSTVQGKIDQALAGLSGADSDAAGKIAEALNGIGEGVSASASGQVVTINLLEHGAINAAAVEGTGSGIHIDIGNDALGFKLDGGAHVDLGYDLDAQLTFDVGSGALTLVDKAGDLVTLHLDAALDNLQGHGSLGILKADLVDQLNDPANPEVQLVAGLDVTGNISTFGQDSVSLTDKITAKVNGSAHLDLGVTVGAVDPSSDAAAVLPTITTDLTASYKLTGYDPIHGTSGGGTPTVELHDIELDVGSALTFIGNFFAPILSEIFDSFPIKQLLNTLTTPLPLINDGILALSNGNINNDPAALINFIKDNSINLLDLAAYGADLSEETKTSIAAFSKAVSLIHALSDLADEAATNHSKIALGDIVLIGGSTTYDPATTGSPMAQFAALKPMDDSGGTATDQLGNALDQDPNQPSHQDGLADPAGSLSEILNGSGFAIPLLSDSKALIGLLVNPTAANPTTLITYDIPKLSFEAGFDKFFPIIGPIGVGIHGGFGAGIDVDVGYDTAGLAAGKGFTDGFFFTTKPLTTPVQIGDETPPDYAYFEPAGTVHAELDAYAGVDVGIASAGVGGGIFADLFAYLKGAEGDGKLRLADFGGGCIFDPITGDFGVKVNAFVKVGFSPFSYTKRWDLVKVVLANFNFGCMSTESDAAHGLATLGPDSTSHVLTLNAGLHAHDRQIGGKAGTDVDESYVIGNAANGALTVSSFGITDINGHPLGGAKLDDKIYVNQVIAHMGDQDDQVAFQPDVAARGFLWGDGGNDLLSTGTGKDELHGGDGLDRLIGGAGDDYLFGDNDDDVLEGGAGADHIDGGDGFDQVTYENSSAGVTFTQVPGKTGSFTGSGGEAEGDVLKSIEQVTGSHFNDVLHGSTGQNNILEGLDGVDILIGSNKQDLLLGGAKGDVLIGGAGDDTVSYISSQGQVYVNLETGSGFNGDAQGDTLDSIENVQGSFGDDLLIGSDLSNIIDGWYGDDIIQAGAGKDEVHGGEGDDTIQASGDHDTIDGGGEIGSPGQDLLTYALMTGPKGVVVNLLTGVGSDTVTRATYTENNETFTLDNYSTIENVTGSAQKDAITGDYQGNILNGGGSDDRLDGSDGNDTLIGGNGADTLIGGDGRDMADYSASNSGVTVSLLSGLGSGGDAAGDKLYQLVNGQKVVTIEDLHGSRYADKLTGSAVDNRIDPGLSRDGKDVVNGGGLFDRDTLVVNWGEGDDGKGLVGGFNVGSATAGVFRRQQATSSDLLDNLSFTNIERLEVIGTTKADTVAGGQDNDFVRTGDGNDVVYTGQGFDDVNTGAGTDAIAVGTDVNRVLSATAAPRFGLIDGGSGIDFLSLSIAAATNNVTLHGTLGLTDFHGTNLAMPDGSAIRNIEVLYAVATGTGDDDLAQPGRWNNVFATGFGDDRIDAGLGKDIVNGGLDFHPGTDVVASDSSPQKLLTVSGDFAQAYDNDGDWLTVDYSKAKAGITSSVTQVNTGYTLARPDFASDTRAIYTNNGFYQTDIDRVDFANIERVTVIGSNYGDRINGTNLTYGINEYVGDDQGLHASDSKRGDDILIGNAGNDYIIGGTGDDSIDGGAGDDVLVGTALEIGRADAAVDLGEIDQLTGGSGRDVFILGTMQPYYGDKLRSDDTGYRHQSSANRAIITDFTKADYLLLAAQNGAVTDPSHVYMSVQQDGNTYIYVRDGQNFDGKYDASSNEMIAELDGVTGFNLQAHYVVYYTTQGKYVYADGSPAPAPGGLATASGEPISPQAAFAPSTDEASPTATAAADHPVDGVDVTNEIATVDLAHVAEAARAGRAGEQQTDAVTEAVTADTVVAPEAAPATSPHWVTQTANTNVLKNALFGNDSPFQNGVMTVSGNSAAFGIFNGDPFGLGKGIVLSTGRVTDLQGANTVDGGQQAAAATSLHFEYAGRIGSTDIFRADVSDLGHSINSIKLQDNSNGQGGGSGEASGFDLDTVVLSHTYLSNLTTDDLTMFNTTLPRVDAFDFNLGTVEFTQGVLRPPQGTLESTAGVDNGLPDLGRATLDTIDGDSSLAHGSVTLGDGGEIGFDLNQTVKTDQPLYLYVGETGGQGESITSASGSASAGRLDAPADLSTDFGLPGPDGDTATLTYTFNTRNTDMTANLVEFDFVVYSEEFAEFAGKGFDDDFKIMLNGVNMAHLSDGAFASIDTLASPPASATQQSSIWNLTPVAQSSDLILNPVGTGPAASQTRADGYSKVLHFVGQLNPGQDNVLTVQVADHGDGLLDSGILIKGGSVMTSTEGSFSIDRNATPLHAGESRDIQFGVNLPDGARLGNSVTVVFTPTSDIDLGAGAGRAVTRTIDPAFPHSDLTLTVVDTGRATTTRYDAIGVQVRGLEGTDAVAPLVVQVDPGRAAQGDLVNGTTAEHHSTDTTGSIDSVSHATPAINDVKSSTPGVAAGVVSVVSAPLFDQDFLPDDVLMSGNARARTLYEHGLLDNGAYLSPIGKLISGYHFAANHRSIESTAAAHGRDAIAAPVAAVISADTHGASVTTVRVTPATVNAVEDTSLPHGDSVSKTLVAVNIDPVDRHVLVTAKAFSSDQIEHGHAYVSEPLAFNFTHSQHLDLLQELVV